MRKFAKIVVGAGAAVALAAFSVLGGGRVFFDRQISGEVENLFASSQRAQPSSVTEAELAEMPEPVQRWLRNSHIAGGERTLTVRLKQEGQFRLGEDKGWMPYKAEQYFTTDPPGFIWKASFAMAPLVTIRGRDRYVNGQGDIDMRVLSLLPVARKSGGGLNQGALLRYLGEIAWFPAAALSPSITWVAVDHNSARATMSYQGVAATATFAFDGDGQVTSITAQRYNDAKGDLEAWTIPIRSYREFNGIRIPVEGDGVWNYNSGDFAYIRWRITDIAYNRPSQY